MRKRRLNSFTLVAALMAASPLSAAELPTAITSVTALTGSAQITRTGRTPLAAGEAVVTVRGLPPGLDERSVRVKARGTATAALRAVDVRRVFLPASPEARVQALQAEMEEVARKIAGKDSQLAALKSQQSFLDSIRVGYGERVSKELGAAAPKPADLGEMLKFLGENTGNVAIRADAVEREKRELAERLDALKRELEAIRSGGMRETKEVEISFDVAKAGEETVEVSYVVPGAGWEAAYDMRLAESGKEVELTYRGLVRQRTGEDWNGVALALSTAKPEAGGTPPELFPWRVRFPRPAPPRRAMKSAMMPAPAAAPMREMPLDEEAAAPQTATIREEQTSVQFDLPKKETVPSDGNPHSVTVAVRSLPTTPEYLTIPKLAPHVFLKAAVVNDKGLPLLPGRVNLFTGGTFVGSSYLKETAPGESIDLFFGADRSLKVKREELSSRREGGFFGKDTFTGSYRIELANFRKEGVTVTVLDQIPVAENEEIVVKLEESAPPAVHTKETGELKWQVPLAPGEKKVITFTFTVNAPKDRRVEGL